MFDFIDATRKTSLWIFLVSIIAAQLAWSERDRQEKFSFYGYLDRVLKIHSHMRNAFERGISKPESANLSAAHFSGDPLRHFPQLEKIMAAGELKEESDLTRTFSDNFAIIPKEQCNFTIGRAPPGKTFHPEFLLSQPLGTERGFVLTNSGLETTENLFLINFSKDCMYYYRYFPPALVFISGRGDLRWAFAFSREIMEKVLTRQEEIPESKILFIRSEPLVERVLFDARMLTGQPYRNIKDGLNDALLDLLSIRVKEPVLFGVFLAPVTASYVLPLMFLALSVSFLYRARRISTGAGQGPAPWLVLSPKGVIEAVAAVAWLLLLLLAFIPIVWIVYEFNSVTIFDLSERWVRLWKYWHSADVLNVLEFFLWPIFWLWAVTIFSAGLLGIAVYSLISLAMKKKPIDDAGSNSGASVQDN